jgi:hypothetical protein
MSPLQGLKTTKTRISIIMSSLQDWFGLSQNKSHFQKYTRYIGTIKRELQKPFKIFNGTKFGKGRYKALRVGELR